MTIEYSIPFEKLWALKPERRPNNSKAAAYRAYIARLKQGHSHDEIRQGLIRFNACMAAQGLIGTKFVMMLSTFLGPDLHFTEDWELPAEQIKESLEQKAKRLSILPRTGESQYEFDNRIRAARD